MWSPGNGLCAIPLKRLMFYGALLVGGLLTPVRFGLVSGDSMDPSLHNGQAYLYDRVSPRISAPGRGDVVLVTQDHRTLVKRVFAGPGDTVFLMRTLGDGVTELVPDWQFSRIARMSKKPRVVGSYRLERKQIPEGHVYLVGDNLAASEDSRSFGPVPISSVKGRVLFAPPPGEDWLRLTFTQAPAHS
jgi:signal peptidase I